MHIPEGMLPAGWSGAWFAATVPFFLAGLRNLNRQLKSLPFFKPLLGLLAAVVFIVSLFPVPVPVLGTSTHPGATPLAAILVGPLPAVVLATVALLLQALFFAHGGLSTLGAWGPTYSPWAWPDPWWR